MKQKKYLCVLGCLFIIGIVTRCYLLGYLPSGVNYDEAMCAVDAYSLSLYGTDRFGTPLPAHFRAWGFSQMSVFMGYLQALCIKLFGFHTTAIRLPIAVLSILGMVSIYPVCKKFTSPRVALSALLLVIICPWHLIQSRWALDCNAFPHVFLIGFTLLLWGVESTHPGKNLLIYISMIFFGLTFYCYGIAVYSVPLFLCLFAIYLLRRRKIRLKVLLISIAIFLSVAFWEIWVMAVNYFELNTVHTPLFTIERFSESIRGNDILFLNFSVTQLMDNCKDMLTVLFIQPPEAGWNNVAKYGSIYPVSGIFGILGVVSCFIESRKKKNSFFSAVLFYLFTAVWIGLNTKDVNVNRLNFIFYPWLICVAMGIDYARTICVFILKKMPLKKLHTGNLISGIGNFVFGTIIVGYIVLGIAFFRLYFIKYDMKYADSCFNHSYLTALEYTDGLDEYDALYITAYTGYGANAGISEILMNYAAKHDALYLQGKRNTYNNREQLPYRERYHYFYSWDENESELAATGSEKGYRTGFLVHENELDQIEMPYDVTYSINDFKIIEYRP